MMHFTNKKINNIDTQIKLGNEFLKIEKSCMFLGVKVDQNLNFETHIRKQGLYVTQI